MTRLDVDALTAACEADGFTPYTARGLAERLADHLSQVGPHGYRVVANQSLPVDAPKGDPRKTSERIEDLPERTHAVWTIIDSAGDHGITGPELDRWYAADNTLPPASTQFPSKRLTELERAGHIARTDQTRNGACVWVSTSAAEQAA